MQRRADFGAPLESFFVKQREPVRSIANALRVLVETAAPKAEASLEWGMPFHTLAERVPRPPL